MDLKTLKEILMDQKEMVEKNMADPGIIEREVISYWKEFTDIDQVKVAMGPRRAGKTVFSNLLYRNLNYGYVNFDDERLSYITSGDLNDVLEVLYEIHGELEYLILDEIQNVAGWELFVNRMRMTGLKIIITGSNANLLSRELATHLTGRHITMEIFPFSFKEYLQFKNIEKDFSTTKKRAFIKKALEEYIEIGGYPEIVKNPKIRDVYTNSLYSSILNKDIVARHRIKYVQTLKEMSYSMISNFATLISYNKIKRTRNMGSSHTAKNYMGYLAESYLVVKLDKFSHKERDIHNSPKKIYAIDPAMINVIGRQSSRNRGRMMENIVMLELLRRRSLDPQIEHFYWRDNQQREIDFVLKKGIDIMELIQVSFSIEDPGVKRRELRSLSRSSDDLNCNDLKIITWNESGKEKIGGKEVEVLPLYQWLLQE